MKESSTCQLEVLESKKNIALYLAEEAVAAINDNRRQKLNVIWIEATGCSGNTISLMNGENPDLGYLLEQMINLKYSNSIMTCEGESAFDLFIKALEKEYILIVEGAVATRQNGLFNTIAKYKGQRITALEAVTKAAEKAKKIIAVGTCAAYGGVSAARPNPSESKSVSEIVKGEVIRLPGCPSHPDWVIGTLAHFVLDNPIKLDGEGRPILFYGFTIHDFCPRRTYFNNKIFANNTGEIGCMFKLGCRGPVTRTDCPTRKWNSYVNWPIGDNAPCIGCANSHFPDGMEPFIRV